MIIPSRLKIGDTIGVVAVSSPITEQKMFDIYHSKELIESAGVKVKFSKHFFSNDLGYSATAEEKAEDLNAMFLDSEISAIFCATGGANSNSILDFLDYELIRKESQNTLWIQ